MKCRILHLRTFGEISPQKCSLWEIVDLFQVWLFVQSIRSQICLKITFFLYFLFFHFEIQGYKKGKHSWITVPAQPNPLVMVSALNKLKVNPRKFHVFPFTRGSQEGLAGTSQSLLGCWAWMTSQQWTGPVRDTGPFWGLVAVRCSEVIHTVVRVEGNILKVSTY